MTAHRLETVLERVIGRVRSWCSPGSDDESNGVAKPNRCPHAESASGPRPPPVALPAFPLAGEQPAADHRGDLPKGRGVLAIPLRLDGKNSTHSLGVEHP